uniref:glycosyltransferase family 2 protein n=1 Tax=Gelidibacter sp. TaxID=2018083 RepID=UPI004048EE17
MKLSVVIPAYNAANFIEKSYQSIINQNLTNFELIYVDNNSTDATVENIHKLIGVDDRVKLILQPKQGAAAARNMGIKASKGDYIYVFDVDDEIYPNAINTMVGVLERYKDVDAVFGKMVKSYKGISETDKPKDESCEVIIKEKPYWGLKWFSDLKTVVGPPAFIYKKHVFDSIGFYNESIRNNEDTAFDVKLGMTSNVAFIDKYVYLYFKHDESTIQTSKRQMPRAFMIWPRLVKEHLPFYLSYDVPKRFETLLFSQLFQSMGRQIVFTKGLANRFQLKKLLIGELSEVKIPTLIQIYLAILAILPLAFLRKLYGYYVVPFVVKHLPQQKA